MVVIAWGGVSFLLSLLVVAVIKERFRQQLLDIPNDRSSHRQPTPRGGGLGFIIAFATVSVLGWGTQTLTLSSEELLWLWLVLLPLAIVGVIDDRFNVPAKIRYLIQLTAASLAVYHYGAFPQPWFTEQGIIGVSIAIILTVIAMTALINFYNFMDGLDGLVAGVSALQLAYLALVFHQPLWWLLVAALGGFLVWNWSPAKIFMGDVGSTVLGASIAIALFSAETATEGWSNLAITLPLVSDAIYTLARRFLKGENIFQAHRTHLYQRLNQGGWSHGQVASTYLVLTALIAILIGVWGSLGSVISLGISITSIVVGEVYLQRQAVPTNTIS